MQSNNDLVSCIFQIVGVRMPLTAIADDGDCLPRQKLRMGIFVVKNLHCVCSFNQETEFFSPGSYCNSAYTAGEINVPDAPCDPLANATGPVRTMSQIPKGVSW